MEVVVVSLSLDQVGAGQVIFVSVAQNSNIASQWQPVGAGPTLLVDTAAMAVAMEISQALWELGRTGEVVVVVVDTTGGMAVHMVTLRQMHLEARTILIRQKFFRL